MATPPRIEAAEFVEAPPVVIGAENAHARRRRLGGLSRRLARGDVQPQPGPQRSLSFGQLGRVGGWLATLLLGLGSADAGDWPQILGPLRNGQAVDEASLEPWSESGPRQIWSVPLGQGYAGPAVAGQRVVVFHRVGSTNRVAAWDVESGGLLWSTDFSARYRGGVNPDTGPRCVPLIHQDRVYLFTAAGKLHCVGLADGKARWTRDAYADFRGREGYFGAGSTPIVSDEKLLVNVGGRDAGLVAFDLETGATRWQATNEGASYSSPTVAKIDGRDAVIFVTRMSTVAVDPRDGRTLFRFAFGRRGPTVNAATPLVFNDRLFVSSSYGVGARLVRLGRSDPATVWENDSVMSSQYTTCVYRAGYLYGAHGREDERTGELRCLEAETGRLCWRAPQTGVAHTILVNDQLLILTTAGKLILAEASPAAYRPLAEADLAAQQTRALPALSGGRLFLRDANRLRCLALRP